MKKVLMLVAQQGLDDLPSAMSHEVNKKERIYEFIKGDLRLLYFKGRNGTVVVCCEGVLKKGQKANPQAVARAVAWKKEYEQAISAGTCQVLPL